MLSLVHLFLAYAAQADPDWTVKKMQYSAVSIGVAMVNTTTGWSSFTDGASGIKITKTTDGGDTWTPVKNQTNALMVMGVDATTAKGLEVVTTGMAATSHSEDGDIFKGSKFGPFVSQSIEATADGRVVTASDDGVQISQNGGATFAKKKVPFKYGPAGRYVSSPSESVIYVTAGSWPSTTPATEELVPLTANLRLAKRSFDGVVGAGARMALEMGPLPVEERRRLQTPTSYTAELWRSSDGGNTWESLLSDEGNYYFNGIDCFDETHCVAVAEGFGHDGSAAPGARVFVTTDGKNFTQAYYDATDGASLMAAKMISLTEHIVGGKLAPGVALHTTDSGATYTAKGTKIAGQMITSMTFPSGTSDFGLATSVNALQICSLLEWSA